MVRERLFHKVPVPEVYGWCRHDGQVFIYMELVQGVTLEQSWDTLEEEDRTSVGFDAGHVLSNQPLLDTLFNTSSSPTAGPFQSVTAFHDWFTSTIGPEEDWGRKTPHPYRSFLPAHVPVMFTHGDLHPSNIIISHGPNPRVVSVIDWHQAGWYPAYWEYCKARWTSRIRARMGGQVFAHVYQPVGGHGV
ncbi:kinase-like domain-containing protein [Ilyonectria sp. MPI-CAGE-AT-0026]|nr:kinase-like domain-containing protein [Ilyonectria sp. MPI-CAGE-AT-0026]